MPTGYTSVVANGQVTEFKDFTMRCARAMGALVELRDEPLSAKLPDSLVCNTAYYDKQLDEHNAELVRLESLTLPEIEKSLLKEHEDRKVSFQQSEDNRAAARKRYEAMLEKVKQWVPPTSNHEGLKQFMLDQLRESIAYDCKPLNLSPPDIKSAEEWLAEAILHRKKDIAWVTQQRQKDIDRTAKANEWLQQLRTSLEPKAGG